MHEVVDFSWLRLVFACSVVALLLAGLAFILKYVSTQGLLIPYGKKQARRLKIIENLALDSKRRVVIVRCDGREHLLLLNASQDIVVEANLPAPPAPDKIS